MQFHSTIFTNIIAKKNIKIQIKFANFDSPKNAVIFFLNCHKSSGFKKFKPVYLFGKNEMHIYCTLHSPDLNYI